LAPLGDSLVLTEVRAATRIARASPRRTRPAKGSPRPAPGLRHPLRCCQRAVHRVAVPPCRLPVKRPSHSPRPPLPAAASCRASATQTRLRGVDTVRVRCASQRVAPPTRLVPSMGFFFPSKVPTATAAASSPKRAGPPWVRARRPQRARVRGPATGRVRRRCSPLPPSSIPRGLRWWGASSLRGGPPGLSGWVSRGLRWRTIPAPKSGDRGSRRRRVASTFMGFGTSKSAHRVRLRRTGWTSEEARWTSEEVREARSAR
jgi:hypothetical protein